MHAFLDIRFLLWQLRVCLAQLRSLEIDLEEEVERASEEGEDVHGRRRLECLSHISLQYIL